jgi:hypothetical protein
MDFSLQRKFKMSQRIFGFGFLLGLMIGFIPLVSSATSSPRCDLKFSKNHLCAEIQWQVGPSVGVENQLRLWFFSADNGRSTELWAPPTVTLFMKEMGHGSAPTSVSRPLNAQGQVTPGVYQVNGIRFLMVGEWDVQFNIPRAEGSVGSAEGSLLQVRL